VRNLTVPELVEHAPKVLDAARERLHHNGFSNITAGFVLRRFIERDRLHHARKTRVENAPQLVLEVAAQRRVQPFEERNPRANVANNRASGAILFAISRYDTNGLAPFGLDRDNFPVREDLTAVRLDATREHVGQRLRTPLGEPSPANKLVFMTNAFEKDGKPSLENENTVTFNEKQKRTCCI
jgi:hypothetical protein